MSKTTNVLFQRNIRRLRLLTLKLGSFYPDLSTDISTWRRRASSVFTGSSYWGGSNSLDTILTGHDNAGTTWRLNAGTTLDATASDTPFHAIQSLYNSTTSNVYIDGTPTTGDANTNNLDVPNSLIIGGDRFGANWIGNVTEVGLWASNITTSMGAMNSNQHTYWGF